MNRWLFVYCYKAIRFGDIGDRTRRRFYILSNVATQCIGHWTQVMTAALTLTHSRYIETFQFSAGHRTVLVSVNRSVTVLWPEPIIPSGPKSGSLPLFNFLR